MQAKTAQHCVQSAAAASGSGQDDSDSDTVKSGGTEPHISSEDEEEEVLTGTIEQPILAHSEADPCVPSSSQQAAAAPDTGEAMPHADIAMVCALCSRRTRPVLAGVVCKGHRLQVLRPLA